jgi:two-component system, NtrC family, sensor kinase
VKNENVTELLNDIFANNEKITLHGKRADSIVKGMLQHSRKSTGEKELADINALADEYLKLAYHGLRAKDKSFNVVMQTNFDTGIGKIKIIPQDIGRVLLNLYNNAFYAVHEKLKNNPDSYQKEKYEPAITVSTKKLNDKVQVTVTDNGNGIPSDITNKIFQPFFTTKPTGEGTGLGLSLSYDIVKAHGGELTVKSATDEGTAFTIVLPL